MNPKSKQPWDRPGLAYHLHRYTDDQIRQMVDLAERANDQGLAERLKRFLERSAKRQERVA